MLRSFLMLFILVAVLSAVAVLSPSSSHHGAENQSSLKDLLSVRSPISSSSGGNVDAESGAAALTMQDLIELAQRILADMRTNLHDYRGVLVKHERIGGKLGTQTRMEFKIRNPSESPKSGLAAYMKFTQPRSARGREVIWIDGRNENKLVVHEGGLLNLLRIELAPDSSLAMLGNKYSVTEIGMLRLVEKLIEKIDRGVDLSQCIIETRDGEMVGDRPCQLIQVTQPRTVPGADFYIAQVFLDTERQIPLRYAAFMWPEQAGAEPPLEEEYTYLDVELNVGLSDSDFDPDNPAYNFP